MKNIILEALDKLALALTEHSHQWTEEERVVYEAAVEEAKHLPDLICEPTEHNYAYIVHEDVIIGLCTKCGASVKPDVK